jgi:hypothetical protein
MRMKCFLPGPAHPSSTAAFIDPKRESPSEVAQVQALHHSNQLTLRSALSVTTTFAQSIARTSVDRPQHSVRTASSFVNHPDYPIFAADGADIPTDCNKDAANPGIAFFARQSIRLADHLVA